MFAIVVVCLFCRVPVNAFSGIFVNKHRKDADRHRLRPCRSSSSSVPSQSTNLVPTGESYSTLTLLEHVHLLTPDFHDENIGIGSNDMLEFFVRVLGFGLDPKSVDNVKKGSGVVFVNCGISQLLLNDGSDFCTQMGEPQKGANPTDSRARGCNLEYEVGLSYNNLASLKEEVSRSRGLFSYKIIDEGGDRETIRITDMHDRVYVARQSRNLTTNGTIEPTVASICQRPSICTSDEDIFRYGADVVGKYGSECQATCRGMDYVEFFVPVGGDDGGNTMEKIATFYDHFFDAPTIVIYDGMSRVAIVGFGKIGDDGRAEQSLLFREMVRDGPPADYGHAVGDPDLCDAGSTGNHIGIYVGANDDDFEVAAANFAEAGLLWTNSNFEDRVLDVESAVMTKKFRFRDIIDVETGDVLYVLEHEVRSTSHHLFPGRTRHALHEADR